MPPPREALTEEGYTMASTAEIAEEFGTDGKTLRKFFRSDACEVEPVGQGSRYELDDEELEDLKTAFDAWAKGKAKKANPATEDGDEEPKPAKKKSKKKAKPEPEVLEDEDLDLDDEPTEDDLAELEDEVPTEDEDDLVEDELELDEEPEPTPKPKKKKSKK